MTQAGWMLIPLVISLLIAVAASFGLSMPNAMNAAMQPLPQIAGAVGAASGTLQMTAGAIASALVALLYDGHSALSMTLVMVLCSLLAIVFYLLATRPATHRLSPSGPVRSVGAVRHSASIGAGLGIQLRVNPQDKGVRNWKDAIPKSP